MGRGPRGSGLNNSCVGRIVLLTFCSTYLLLLGNAAFALRPLCVAHERRWCGHDYPRWGAHNTSYSILLHPRARRTGFYHRVGAPTTPPVRGSDLLSQIETFVTLCGMVWLRGGLEAMVLGRLGRKLSPHPRACALSCPSSAIYGPGSLGHLTRPFALPHPDKPCSYQDDQGRGILRGVPALLRIHGQSGSLGGCGGLYPVA